MLPLKNWSWPSSTPIDLSPIGQSYKKETSIIKTTIFSNDLKSLEEINEETLASLRGHWTALVSASKEEFAKLLLIIRETEMSTNAENGITWEAYTLQIKQPLQGWLWITTVEGVKISISPRESGRWEIAVQVPDDLYGRAWADKTLSRLKNAMGGL